MHPNPEKVVRALDNVVTEYLDDYVLCGFVAGTNQPIVVAKCRDTKTALALNQLLSGVVVNATGDNGQEG